MRTFLKSGNSDHDFMKEWPELWQAAYRSLEQSIVPNQLQAWIQLLEMDGTENVDNRVRVRMIAPNDFIAGWVRDHYRRAIEEAFSQVTGMASELVLIVREGEGDPSLSEEPPA